MAKSIGILTAGGDSPGLNAAIRAIGKSAIRDHGWAVIGFKDGFRGLMQNRFVRLESSDLSGILSLGGTILGTGRDKVDRMDVGGSPMDMRDAMLDTFERHQLKALVCLGGGGTQRNALQLSMKGMPIVTLPKTIDNDVHGTDRSFGFDTALSIASEAVDRLHSTAHSHHRIMLVEIMGHNTGWLTLGAGVSGGADVILIPEIPYSMDLVAEAIKDRRTKGSTFSIVAVAEGAVEDRLATKIDALGSESNETSKEEEARVKKRRRKLMAARLTTTEIAKELANRTGLEARITILGYVQRGGPPSALDRILATNLGAAATDVIEREEFGVMVAARNDGYVTVPLSEVAGNRHTVPLDHPWIRSARSLGVCMGDHG